MRKISTMFFSINEFLDEVRELGVVDFEYDIDGISFYDKDDNECSHEICEYLSKKYGVTVTSIHADGCELLGIWVAYKE